LPTEEQICASIPPDTSVLEFFELGSSVIQFLIDRDGLKGFSMSPLEEPLEAIFRRFRDEIDLGETTRLVIVPHRSLHLVPFSALWFEPAGDNAPPKMYLKNQFYLTVSPSASWLQHVVRPAAKRGEHGPALVLGNPTGDLDGAEVEARRVAAKLGVVPRLRAQATRAAILDCGTPSILHVASHGTHNATDPLLSGLHLADGFVTVEDMLTSGPAPELLVLSGCVTGVSGRRPGDELVGLAQAALRHGTRSVVATLWETFDESSTRFFEHFYDALMSGNSVSASIAWARDTLSTGPGGYDQPVDWAAFVLIGDPETCPFEALDTPMKEFERETKLQAQGDTEGAKSAFQSAIDGDSTREAAWAALALGALFNSEGDVGRAHSAWRSAADSGQFAVGPLAMIALARLLEKQQDLDGARAEYERAIESNHPQAAPKAAFELGLLLTEQGDLAGARARYQDAVDSGDSEVAPQAANALRVAADRAPGSATGTAGARLGVEPLSPFGLE
jgi:hypothetical protein